MADTTMPHDGPVVTRVDAASAGEKCYFTGLPCRNGHVAQRRTSCGNCIACEREAEKRRKPRPHYYAENRERCIAAVNRCYAKTKERRKAVAALWREANREKHRLIKQSRYWANREKELLRAKVYRENNRERMRMHNKRRRGWMANGENFQAEDITDIMRMQRGRCGYCRTSIKTGKYHIDHIYPLARGGSNERKNLQLLCVPCNKSKHARHPLVHARRIGLLL